MVDFPKSAAELASRMGYVPLPEKIYRIWENGGTTFVVTTEWVVEVDDPDQCVTPGCLISDKLLHDPFAGSYMSTRVVNLETLEVVDNDSILGSGYAATPV
jgi:hypothetical protein